MSSCESMPVRSLVRLRWAVSVKRRISTSSSAVDAARETRFLSTAATHQPRKQPPPQHQHDRSKMDVSRQPVSALSSSTVSRPSALPVAPWNLTPRPVSVSALGTSSASFARRNIAIIGAPGSGPRTDSTTLCQRLSVPATDLLSAHCTLLCL